MSAPRPPAAPAPARLDGVPAGLKLIDGLRLSGFDDAPLGLKSRALLALLALSEGRSERRAQIAAVLWPEASAERARAALRQRVRGLRDLGRPLLRVGGEALAIDPEIAPTDLDDLLEALDRRVVPAVLLENRDPLATLARSEADASQAFAAWVETRRVALRRRAVEALRAMLDEPRASAQKVRDVCRALLALDPMNEACARRLMTTLAALGEESQALMVYDDLWRRLDAEHDLEPSAETQALVARIRLGEPVHEQAPQRRVERRLSVLQPVADGEARLAADFVRIDIAERLSAFRSWRVTLDPPTADDHRLFLAVAEADRGWRLTALVTEPDGRVLGGARALLPRRDWTDALDAEAPRLAAAVAIALDGQEIDPGAGGAAKLAGPSIIAMIVQDDPPGPEAAEAAWRRASAAVAADPLDAAARLEAGWAELYGGRPESAAASFRLAAALNPSDGQGVLGAAFGLASVGRYEAAAETLSQEAALEAPRTPLATALRALTLHAIDHPEAADALKAAAGWSRLARRLWMERKGDRQICEETRRREGRSASAQGSPPERAHAGSSPRDVEVPILYDRDTG